jgi:hypothetical protein
MRFWLDANYITVCHKADTCDLSIYSAMSIGWSDAVWRVGAHCGADETVFQYPRSRPETDAGLASRHINNGLDRHGRHPQRDLPPFPQGRPLWHGGDPRNAPMIEIVTAALAFLSISVFLAQAFNAYRTG